MRAKELERGGVTAREKFLLGSLEHSHHYHACYATDSRLVRGRSESLPVRRPRCKPLISL